MLVNRTIHFQSVRSGGGISPLWVLRRPLRRRACAVLEHRAQGSRCNSLEVLCLDGSTGKDLRRHVRLASPNRVAFSCSLLSRQRFPRGGKGSRFQRFAWEPSARSALYPCRQGYRQLHAKLDRVGSVAGEPCGRRHR